MPYKDPAKQKAAQASHYQQNKDRFKQRARDRIERNRRFVREYKEGCSCEVCGEDRWQVLDFHHKDEGTKYKGVANLVCNRSSIKKIKAEIAKCMVVCANCHRMIHEGNTWS